MKKKVNKGKEGSENSDVEKTPLGSPHPEEEDDAGIQVFPLVICSYLIVEHYGLVQI